MKSVDLFSNIAEQVFEDTHVRKYGYLLVTRGVSGLGKLNPTVVWVDATVAVIEAVGSYFRYCAAAEVTQQLQEYNRILEITLNDELQIGESELNALRRERTTRQDMIKRQLSKTEAQARLTHKEIRKQLDTLQRIQLLLRKERARIGPFRELIGLQVCLDSCIDATLALLLSSTGEYA